MADVINAHPTKKLVAYVLTKDIKLEDAVLDLMDNSIDGARRASKKNLRGYYIQVTLNKDCFKIEDNCGGIPYEIAKEYAFRFGRTDAYLPLDGPPDVIGNFGVGMKRALFKMGRNIKIISRTSDVTFTIDIDVDSWMADDKNWNFDFSSVEHHEVRQEEVGTTIVVTGLYNGVAEQFGLAQFNATLKSLAKEKQALSLLDGLTISINDDVLTGMEMRLLASKDVTPFHKKVSVQVDNASVDVSIFAGLDEPDNDKAGWYVICNGRTILHADRSAVTGWGNKMQGERVPSYHHQYARFRGYLIFHSLTPNALPWNTTKTGVDAEHPLYRRFLQEMIAAMRQVFSFLNAVDREADVAEQPLTEHLGKLRVTNLRKIKESATFTYPIAQTTPKVREKLRWIRYQRPIQQVEQVMQSLEVDRPEEVGERTFDLYYSLNIES